jgi:hypothetical protein
VTEAWLLAKRRNIIKRIIATPPKPPKPNQHDRWIRFDVLLSVVHVVNTAKVRIRMNE